MGLRDDVISSAKIGGPFGAETPEPKIDDAQWPELPPLRNSVILTSPSPAMMRALAAIDAAARTVEPEIVRLAA